MILNVDPLLEPANGPNWFPFDPEILYEIHVDTTKTLWRTLVSRSASRRNSSFPISR